MELRYPPGTVLRELYRIERVLHDGSASVILNATQSDPAREVAVKLPLPIVASQALYDQVIAEAKRVYELHGAHVTRIHDVGRLPDGVPYMVMEHLRGVNLAVEIQRRGTLPAGETVDHLLQACEALAEAHARCITHCDIKPGHLFLAAKPDGKPLIKILDYGGAMESRGCCVIGPVRAGTPGYIAPERTRDPGLLGVHSDIWGLGKVMYQCLTGLPRPSSGDVPAVSESRTAMARRLPHGLRDIVLRCLADDPCARYSSVLELASVLVRHAGDRRAAAGVIHRTERLLLHQRPAAGWQVSATPLPVQSPAPAAAPPVPSPAAEAPSAPLPRAIAILRPSPKRTD